MRTSRNTIAAGCGVCELSGAVSPHKKTTASNLAIMIESPRAFAASRRESRLRLRRNPANRGRHHQAADAAEEYAHANQRADRPDLARRPVAQDQKRQRQRDDAVKQEPP